MKDVIREILEGIPKGKIFDNHFFITQLIKHHSDAYLTFASSMNADSNITLAVHGQIGKEIERFVPEIIERIEGISWSENIHGKPSECAIWKKL